MDNKFRSWNGDLADDAVKQKTKKYLSAVENLARIWHVNPERCSMPDLVKQFKTGMEQIGTQYGHSRASIEADISNFRSRFQEPEHEQLAREFFEKDL